MYAGAYGPSAAMAQSRHEEQQHYENVRDVELLEVRTRQLKALQADYLRGVELGGDFKQAVIEWVVSEGLGEGGRA